MNWPRPLMTDSGGFQVFSLGFGRDFGVGKVIKYFNSSIELNLAAGSQPAGVKILEDGVRFKSPLDGSDLFLGPKQSIKIQEQLGADIIFAFDECTPPNTSLAYAKQALERTFRWAEVCLKTKISGQALFGIVQGSRFKSLRLLASRKISQMGFDGFGIGGDLGFKRRTMFDILDWTVPNLEPQKPRHLLGIGKVEDIEPIIKKGIDTFDCIVPTHYGRRGVAFTSRGKLNLRKSEFLADNSPLDKNCGCFVCQNYQRSYLAHLIRAKEITGLKLLTFHNLYYFNSLVGKIRAKIKKGLL